MKRLGRLLVFIGIVIAFSTGKLLAGESDFNISPSQIPSAVLSLAGESDSSILHSEIPSAVVSCRFVLSHPLQFKSVIGADAANPIKKLIDGFDRFSPQYDINVRLGFVHYDFIVQGDVVGNYSGFLSTGHDPNESTLFVTTPLDSFSKRSLVIISSVSPEKLTIIGIDRQLRMELLYDSIGSIGKDSKVPFLCSVYGIKVIAPGKIKLLERSGRCGGWDVKRQFLLDVSGGTFKLTVADVKIWQGP